MKRPLFATLALAAAATGGIWLAADPFAPAQATAQQTAAVTAAAQPADAATYQIDPVHTSVIFGIEWGGMSPFYGQFTDYSGTVTYDGQNPESFSCEILIPVDSIDTHNDQRNRHLKSPDFFNAREFPLISFKSTGLSENGDGTYTIKGEVTMHGVTKPVEAKVTQLSAKETQQGNRCGLGAEMTLKRSDFGIDFMIGQGLGDEVKLMIGVQSVQK